MAPNLGQPSNFKIKVMRYSTLNDVRIYLQRLPAGYYHMYLSILLSVSLSLD